MQDGPDQNAKDRHPDLDLMALGITLQQLHGGAGVKVCRQVPSSQLLPDGAACPLLPHAPTRASHLCTTQFLNSHNRKEGMARHNLVRQSEYGDAFFHGQKQCSDVLLGESSP